MSVGDFRLGVLTSGENILWQGQPVPGFTPSVFGFFILSIGGFVAVGTLLFMAMLRSGLASREITGTPETIVSVWLFLSSLLAICLGVMASAVLWPRYKRKNTWYTVTTNQIFIATRISFVGKYLQSFMIQDCKAPELQDGRLQSVFFAEKTVPGAIHDYGAHSDTTVQIGFERIRDGHEVYRLLRKLQAPTAERKDDT